VVAGNKATVAAARARVAVVAEVADEVAAATAAWTTMSDRAMVAVACNTSRIDLVASKPAQLRLSASIQRNDDFGLGCWPCIVCAVRLQMTRLLVSTLEVMH